MLLLRDTHYKYKHHLQRNKSLPLCQDHKGSCFGMCSWFPSDSGSKNEPQGCNSAQHSSVVLYVSTDKSFKKGEEKKYLFYKHLNLYLKGL